jgi:hypothetical protein
MKENNYTCNSTYKGMARKNDYISEIILLYNPQKDKSFKYLKEASQKWWNKQLT